MNQTQVELYEAIKRHDAAAAEQYVVWCNNMERADNGPAADNKKRGAALARLNEIVGNLDSQLEGIEARHLLLWAISGSPSTTDLTDAQAAWLLRATAAKSNNQFIVDVVTGNHMRSATIALIKEHAYEKIGEDMPDKPAGPKPPGPTGPPTPNAPSGPSGPPKEPPSTREVPVEAETEEADVSRLVERVSEAQWHAEAPLSATARIGIGDYDWLVTLRAGVDGEMFSGFASLLKRATDYFERHGFTPVAAPSVVSGGDQAQAHTQGGEGILDSGTRTIEYIQVDPDTGQVKFKLQGLEWPLKDSRGADVVAGMCADETNLTSEYFQPGVTITANQMQEWYGQALQADYIKKKKGERTYWDVTRVHL